MPKETTVLTIDVGGDSLKIAEFDYPAGGGIVLKDFAFRKLNDQDDEQGVAFFQLYHEILAEKHFTAKQVRLSISGQSSFSRLSKLPPLIGNKSAISRIVEYEARQTVPYAMNEVVWDYQLIRHAWDDSHEETQEDGSVLQLSDSHEEFEALFVAVKTDLITRYTNIIEDSGKEIISVEVASVALFNAAKGGMQCADDESVLLLNIGGRGTNLMIADHNRVFIRSIPIAGDAITHQVAKEYAIDFNEAEELKHRHGFVALGGAYEEPESVVAATISKIARNVMTRLHGEVSRSINAWRAQHGGNAPTRVLLSGGGSTMLYITDFFQEKLRLPVEYLNTFGTITIGDAVNKEMLQSVAPMFQELIGMSLRGVTQCPIDISLVPPAIKNQKLLDHKKPYFYVAAVSLIICLLIFAFGVNRRLQFDKTRVSRVQGHVEETNKMAKRVNGLNSELQSSISRYQEMRRILEERNLWTSILTELQSLLPDHMWLSSIEGVGTIVDSTPTTERGGGGFEDFGGGPFGGGMAEGGGTALKSAKRDTTRVNSINMTEILGLKLTGYRLVLNREVLEAEFEKKLKESKYFEIPSSEWGYKDSKDSSNLTSFELRVKLKEPIKK